MELIRGIHNLRSEHHGCVATIGKFDGVHLGHVAILKQLGERAAAMRLPALVILFEPHPGEYFQQERAPARINSLVDKLRLIEAQGVSRVLCLHFNRAMREMSAQQFIEQVLVASLGIKHLVVGDDFRFGCAREGDYATLRQAGDALGFSVEDTHTLEVRGTRVSSTYLRDALADNDFALVQQLCERPYAISGRVVRGQALARTLGTPTANIKIHPYNTALKGVYAVELTTADGTTHQGVANIGKRPTVGGSRSVLEVHVFNFDRDIYCQRVEVVFRHFIRGEQKFAGLDQLKQAIENDIAAAERFFAAAKQ
ncbi:MAG: bifunctional riboflavin kinase/FAD synthetase [Pseudomonadales bacterium]